MGLEASPIQGACCQRLEWVSWPWLCQFVPICAYLGLYEVPTLPGTSPRSTQQR